EWLTIASLWVISLLLNIVCLNEIRWCTISEPENRKCNDMKTSFAQAQILPSLSCVSGESSSNCIQKLTSNQADAVTLDGSLIYEAGKHNNLKPVVAEVYDQDVGTSYYAVAVVRRSSSITIDNLKGARSCHTGIERTAGWKVPMGFLMDSGRMSVMGCTVPNAVSNFFSKSCVPGADKVNYPSLCELCSGSGTSKCNLDSNEPYYDYNGAFRCLAEGAGEVAFIKHSTVFENSDGKYSLQSQWANNIISADYQLLCRDGSRAEVDKWRQCNIARVPARAVVTRPEVDGSILYRFLHEGQQRFQDGSTFKMFDSTAYGGTNLLFKDSTVELRPITFQTYQEWLGKEYLQATQGIDCNPDQLPKMLRWCTLSTSEIWKCAAMASAFTNKTLYPSIQCVSADSTADCMKLIQEKQIDAVMLDGGDIYKAGKMYGLVPAAGEKTSADDIFFSNIYYAVALVHKNSSDAFTIHELKGRKSCHTGYERTAGWNVPIGALIRRKVIRPDGCNIAKAVASFFSKSCVPGANQKNFPPQLCELCKNNCDSSDSEPYFGYSGAFRCLAEKAGEVAFVKHSTVFENTNGNNTESWASGLASSDFQLLCPNGARAEVTQYVDCNWAQVPAHAVMVHPDTNIHAVFGLLDRAQEYYGSDDNSEFKMYDSAIYNSKDLIFKDSTNKIVPVKEKRTMENWLGTNYVDSIEGLQCSSSTGMLLDLRPVFMRQCQVC
uniref:Melanotransferrin n=1 Tax=Leptobrachium leishanense TaxID=445787 RepID=A0A8C5MGX6_9ANUR